MPIVPPEPVTITIAATAAHLPIVRAALAEMCRLAGFDEPCCDGIVLAVDEALANVIEHAYGGDCDQRVELSMTALVSDGRQEGLQVELADRGKVVAGEAIHGRDLTDVRPGGLGTHIMGVCMDEIEYRPRPGGGAILRMVKRLVDPSEAEGSAGDRSAT